VTKYTGSRSSSDLQRSEDFLAMLETQLAAAFVKSSGADYLDRGNLDEIFRELHLSSASVFDASSGALRGLLGRLDYLVVAESSSPTLARVRVLDVETGAVKVATICQAHTSVFGGFSTAEPECIPSIVTQTEALAKVRLALKRQRLMKAAADERAAEAQRAEQQREAERKRAQAEQVAAQKEAEQVEQRKADELQRAEVERVAQEKQAETEHQVAAIRPRYEDVIARLSGEAAFWEHLGEQMRGQGLTLRPEVQAALKSAHTTADRCGEALAARKPDVLNTCISDLSHKVDQLQEYR
jgi:Skp family chaperone for outer membrane proteins